MALRNQRARDCDRRSEVIGFRFLRSRLMTPVVLETNLDGLTLARRGKVRDVYDLGDHLLIVATDRISAFDYVLGIRHSRQGQSPHAAVGVLVRSSRRSRAASLRGRRRRHVSGGHAPASRRAARAVDARARRRIRCRSSASRAAICRDRAGRTTRAPARSAAFRCRRACASPTGCRSRSSRRRRKPSRATTRTSARRRPAKSSAAI